MKYPITPELLDALPEELAELFRALEITLLDGICSRLKAADQLNEVTVQHIRALRAQGVDLDDIKKTIREQTGVSEQKLDELISDVVARNQSYYTEMIDFAGLTQPEFLVGAAEIDAIRRQTLSDFRNITRSMAFVVDNGRTVLQPTEAYQWALDNAVLQIESGTTGYNQAISSAVRQLADSGLRVVSYESGRTEQIDVAVRRAVMTGVSQLCDKYTVQSAEYLGTHYFEVSAHSGARDKPGPSPWSSHKDWQGKVYSERTGDIYPSIYAVCGLGEVDGLEGVNCRHRRFPWVEGVSERTYTDEQLAHIDDGHDADYDGRHYSAYEASQMQRRVENTMRKLKRRQAAYKAAGLKDEEQATSIRLRRLNTKYKEFSRAAGLPEQRERIKALYANDGPNTLNAKADSGTISMGIDRPVNARNTADGKPDAITILGTNLNKRQETLLSGLRSYNSRIYVRKRDVSMKDLSALTAKTGDEFAMFTKGGQRLIVRGDNKSVQIGVAEAAELAALGYRWSGHTHPGNGELTKMASRGDVEVLKAFRQAQSAIYDSFGRYEIFKG